MKLRQSVNADSAIVRVPGARLHTECSGDGPPLVLIPGGGGDAVAFKEVVPLLARRHTVLTFDRRGNSRSPLDDPDGPIEVAVQADDVVAVLDHYGIGRAYVFGTSGSAIITLELLSRHEDRLLGAVVHEPPLVQALPDDSAERRTLQDIAQLGLDMSPIRAYAAFGAMTMPRPPRMFVNPKGQAVIAGATRCALAVGGLARRVTRGTPGGMTRMLGNADLLILRELPSFCFDYRPDLSAGLGGNVPWCLAVGRDSAGRPYDAPARVLAERLGVACAEFPGGHTVYQQLPEEFTSRLTMTLDTFAS